MSDNSRQSGKLIRFDFPAGESAEAIAKAINEMRERIRAEKKARECDQSPKEDPPQGKP
jgi:hypothetical protein